MNDAISAILGFLALVVTILGGVVKFLYGRISEVQAALAKLDGDLREDMQTQASDHRNAQRDLWQELRTMSKADSEQHAHMLERISELATRDDVRSDLAAMENRLLNTLRKEVPNR